jgi:hypothetical protein
MYHLFNVTQKEYFTMAATSARHKLAKFVVVALAATSFLAVAAMPAQATVYRNISFNLTGHGSYSDWAQAWGPGGDPNATFLCYGTLTSNSGSTQSHRVGVYDWASNTVLYGGYTTAFTAGSPVATCLRGYNILNADQSTSASITRNYTMRGNG